MHVDYCLLFFFVLLLYSIIPLGVCLGYGSAAVGHDSRPVGHTICLWLLFIAVC